MSFIRFKILIGEGLNTIIRWKSMTKNHFLSRVIPGFIISRYDVRDPIKQNKGLHRALQRIYFNSIGLHIS